MLKLLYWSYVEMFSPDAHFFKLEFQHNHLYDFHGTKNMLVKHEHK